MRLNGLTLTAAMAAIILAGGGCDKGEGNGVDDRQTGRIMLQLSAEDNIADVTRSNVSDITPLPDKSDFDITITKEDDAPAWSGKQAAIPADGIELPAGRYVISATYGSADEEGFDKPYFTTRPDGIIFMNTGGKTDVIKVPVKLGNSIIKVVATEAFDKYFTDYTFTVTTGAGKKIDFHKGETRGAFIDAYKFSMNGTLTSQSGKSQSFTSQEYTVEAATCYTVKFDVGGAGGMTINISFDRKVTEITLDDIELND